MKNEFRNNNSGGMLGSFHKHSWVVDHKNDIFDPTQNDCSNEMNDAQKINFEAIELTWIFTGKSAKSFIRYLSE